MDGGSGEEADSEMQLLADSDKEALQEAGGALLNASGEC